MPPPAKLKFLSILVKTMFFTDILPSILKESLIKSKVGYRKKKRVTVLKTSSPNGSKVAQINRVVYEAYLYWMKAMRQELRFKQLHWYAQFLRRKKQKVSARSVFYFTPNYRIAKLHYKSLQCIALFCCTLSCKCYWKFQDYKIA